MLKEMRMSSWEGWKEIDEVEEKTWEVRMFWQEGVVDHPEWCKEINKIINICI